MSIDYTLDIATDQEPATLFRSLVETCSFTKISEEVVEKDDVIAGVFSRERTSAFSRAFFQKEYGFTPSVAVWFQPRKSDHNFTSQAKYVRILKSAITLLEHFPGDAVLVCDTGPTVLRRLNGYLEMDIRWYEGVALEGLALEHFAYLAEKYS
jgi:hypothetical protein